jgi:hypothetical protein
MSKIVIRTKEFGNGRLDIGILPRESQEPDRMEKRDGDMFADDVFVCDFICVLLHLEFEKVRSNGL